MVPQFGGSITGAGYEDVVGIKNGNAHDITGVVIEDTFRALLLNIPQNASGVATTGHNLVVANEAAARQIPIKEQN